MEKPLVLRWPPDRLMNCPWHQPCSTAFPPFLRNDAMGRSPAQNGSTGAGISLRTSGLASRSRALSQPDTKKQQHRSSPSSTSLPQQTGSSHNRPSRCQAGKGAAGSQLRRRDVVIGRTFEAASATSGEAARVETAQVSKSMVVRLWTGRMKGGRNGNLDRASCLANENVRSQSSCRMRSRNSLHLLA